MLCFKVVEEEYQEQVKQVADILQRTVLEPDQQSDTLLDVLASFFEGVANVTTSTILGIPSQVRVGCVHAGIACSQQLPPHMSRCWRDMWTVLVPSNSGKLNF